MELSSFFECSYQFTRSIRIRKVCVLGYTFGYIFGLPVRLKKSDWRLTTSKLQPVCMEVSYYPPASFLEKKQGVVGRPDVNISTI